MHFAPDGCSAPLIALAELAGLTRHVRLGTTSLLLPLHPADALAAEIAALDQLSGGRLLIGLGRGFQKRMLQAFGVEPNQKRDRFDETLDRMLSLWIDANGITSDEFPRPFATQQQPHPPLAVAAFGPKGLAQAASRGLPYLASPVETTEQLEANQARHRELSPGSDPRPLSIVMRTVFVSESESEREAARASLEAEGSQRGARLPAAIAQAFDAPLAERVVVGSRHEVEDRLSLDQARLGIDLLIVRPGIRGVATTAQEDSLRCLAETIWPLVCKRASAGDAQPQGKA
jgi:alkanesulfonate monooxygenase SsuD/methylene tetrahydromethanopterin reductase-like flavin-dependent oxidoreductase (luciferase family)